MEGSSRAVRFHSTPTFYYYKASDNNEELNYRKILQESLDRSRSEYSFLQANPKTQLDRTSLIFEECREHDITVIFGNLGRHPLLLTYFLDFVFTSKESVGLVSEWNTDSPYQIKPPIQSLDFLFVVEPYFGYSVVKPPDVKHLVVLTSHLVLNLTTCHMTKLLLTPVIELKPCCSNSLITLKPPVFHDGKVNQIPPKMRVHLDVTDALSAHEAYVRLLTGQEMARDRHITMQMSPRDQRCIYENIKKSREKAIALGWHDNWIHDNYLKFLENSEKPYIVLKRPRSSY